MTLLENIKAAVEADPAVKAALESRGGPGALGKEHRKHCETPLAPKRHNRIYERLPSYPRLLSSVKLSSVQASCFRVIGESRQIQ